MLGPHAPLPPGSTTANNFIANTFLTGTCDGDFSIIISPKDIASVRPQLLLRDAREGEDAGGLLENGGGVHMCPYVGEVSTGVVGGGTVEGEVVTQQH